MTKKHLYTLTDEHRAKLDPWRDKWIANALRTGPYSSTRIAKTRTAMRGLYRSANLSPPERGVFAGSPISAGIAAGVAAGVWYLRDHPSSHLGLFGRRLFQIAAAVNLPTLGDRRRRPTYD